VAGLDLSWLPAVPTQFRRLRSAVVSLTAGLSEALCDSAAASSCFACGGDIASPVALMVPRLVMCGDPVDW
ncbi:hypothetical protein ABTJ87_20010, partial [Acinetobacter baumannii]